MLKITILLVYLALLFYLAPESSHITCFKSWFLTYMNKVSKYIPRGIYCSKCHWRSKLYMIYGVFFYINHVFFIFQYPRNSDWNLQKSKFKSEDFDEISWRRAIENQAYCDRVVQLLTRFGNNLGPAICNFSIGILIRIGRIPLLFAFCDKESCNSLSFWADVIRISMKNSYGLLWCSSYKIGKTQNEHVIIIC